jgi:probable rRNA maturation factor
MGPRGARGQVGIAIVPDRVVRKLNRTYRGIDRPTDVLSFPAQDGGAKRSRTGPRFLGDIAIASGVARRQARHFGHPLTVELRILALHGLLHLLGYDHETDQGNMIRFEERLRRRAGLPTGLVARASGPFRPVHR